MATPIDLATVNGMSRGDFVATFGDVFEHSSWIAKRAFDARPFKDITGLHQAMVAKVDEASDEEKLSLLRAHPELAGREAQAGALTSSSTSEQASVGFNALSKEEIARVARLNAKYQARFEFPFIIAVRQNTKNDIFEQWQRRLENSRIQEIAAGLEQVYVIARLRLDGLLQTSEQQLEKHPMGKLSTHVLDTARGRPAPGVQIDLLRLEDGNYRLLKTVHTNKDGRTDELLLDASTIATGQYQLVFHVGLYFAKLVDAPSQVPFLDEVPVRFAISDANANYHVPLVVSPWSYSTYRGS